MVNKKYVSNSLTFSNHFPNHFPNQQITICPTCSIDFHCAPGNGPERCSHPWPRDSNIPSWRNDPGMDGCCNHCIRLYQNGWSTSHQPIPAIQWWYDWNLIISTKTDQPVVAWISTYPYLAMAQNHWPPKKNYCWSMLKFRKKIKTNWSLLVPLVIRSCEGSAPGTNSWKAHLLCRTFQGWILMHNRIEVGANSQWAVCKSDCLNSHQPCRYNSVLGCFWFLLSQRPLGHLVLRRNRACLQQSISSKVKAQKPLKPILPASTISNMKLHELSRNTQTSSENVGNLVVPLVAWWNCPSMSIPLAKSPGKISGRLPHVAQWPTQLPRHQRQLLVVSEWGNQ